MLERGLEALPYPEESSETPPDSSPGAPEPVGLSLTVPDYVLLLEAPRVALWDPTGSASLGSKTRRASCRPAWLTPQSVCEWVHAWVKVQYCKAL